MPTLLDFEKSIFELEGKIEELKRLDSNGENDLNIEDEIKYLQSKVDKKLEDVYANLSPWHKVKIARHQNRPRALQYINHIFSNFTQLCGDRSFADDDAIIGGLANITLATGKAQTVMIIAQERGQDLSTRIKHNFGMPKPEGYRKAERLMKLADRFGFPIITLVDTPGAFPGLEAEERGQAQAIASCIETCFQVKVPIITTIIGEGGSGGAIAIACGDCIMMLEHAVYSVISPEGCASILWRSADFAEQAAEALKITATDLLSFKIIDKIIKEPVGGAHRHPDVMIASLKSSLLEQLEQYIKDDGTMTISPEKLLYQRQQKFLAMTNLGENIS
jgi:acetyl-CoA carboxylase carboxyl transferase subunit alpha